MSDTLVQWRDSDGAWHRGYPVQADEAWLLLWYGDEGSSIREIDWIGKLHVVPIRND